MVVMFVGPDFSGHHFIASDAHDTWESKNGFIPNLKPRPFKSLIHDIQNPCKIEYGDLRRNYANLRRNLGMCFLAFVYFFFKRIFGILSGKHHGLLTTFLQQQAVTGLAKPLTLDQNDGREEMNQNLWPM